MRYCLDANVFVESHRRYYAFDIAPPFWDALIRWAAEQVICSPIAVYDELTENKDTLAEWLKANKTLLFVEPDDATQIQFSAIADLVMEHYEEYRAKEFLSCADPWVIAQAKAHNLTVVTLESRGHEEIDPKTQRFKGRVKIPNVCRHVGFPCIDTFAMLRALGFKFR